MNDKILNVNLTVFKDRSRFGNFGDEISKVIVGNLINTSKYNLLYNQKDTDINIVGIGSYILAAKNNSYIF